MRYQQDRVATEQMRQASENTITSAAVLPRVRATLAAACTRCAANSHSAAWGYAQQASRLNAVDVAYPMRFSQKSVLVRSDVHQLHESLAKACSSSWSNRQNGARPYALQYCPRHLCRSQQWTPLEKL